MSHKWLIALAALLVPALAGAGESYASHGEARSFIDNMVARHDFNTVELAQLFAQVHKNPRIVELISRPAEAKPWYLYRQIFLTDKRITKGVEFWRDHRETLERAAREYGVAPEMIVAIIGVETFYGGNTGSFPVIESLATLAFDYPKRGKFFRQELEHFLLLAREEHADPLTLKGSYAGAMGYGQFMPSSYRSYAVDFDHDGQRDIWGSVEDAIGSVANYFSVHGWKPGGTVAVRARVEGEDYRPLLETGLKPKLSLRRLEKYGVLPEGETQGDELAALVRLEQADGEEFWLGFDNFYVITRYNRSPLYAMAAWQLSRALADGFAARERAEQDAPQPGS